MCTFLQNSTIKHQWSAIKNIDVKQINFTCKLTTLPSWTVALHNIIYTWIFKTEILFFLNIVSLFGFRGLWYWACFKISYNRLPVPSIIIRLFIVKYQSIYFISKWMVVSIEFGETGMNLMTNFTFYACSTDLEFINGVR